MAFEEELGKLAALVKKHKPDVKNEAQTKQSLVIPFISVLGWDVRNPCEVEPEYAALSMGSRGRPFTVDYALKTNKNPVIFIEVKNIDDDLAASSNQLESYFNITQNVKLAILTNGLIYRFFTDSKQKNKMDSEPFFEFNIEKYDQYSDVEILERFQKTVFNPAEVAVYASQLSYFFKIRSEIREIMRYQPDYFVKFLAKKLEIKNITKKRVEHLRKLVKQCISSVLTELKSQDMIGIITEPGKTTGFEGEKTKSKIELRKSLKKNDPTATEEELKAFQIIKELVSHEVENPERLYYSDAKMYFSIYLESPICWLVRLYLGPREKHLITKLSPEEVKRLAPKYLIDSVKYKGNQKGRIHISKIEDLFDLKEVLLSSIKTLRVVKESGLPISEEKIKAFNMIKEIISGFVSEPGLIRSEDKKNYFLVYFGTRFKWIARFFIGPREMSVVINLSVDEANKLTPEFTVMRYQLKNKVVTRIRIAKIDDLQDIKDLLVQTLKEVAGSSYTMGI